MALQGLSSDDTQKLMEKLQLLRVNILADEKTIQGQTEELRSKQEAMDRVYSQLQTIRKELLVSGGAMSSAEFRQSVSKYLREIREEVDYFRRNHVSKTLKPNVVNVVVTGAAGQIGYSLLPLLATGQVFGLDQPISLRMLEITPALKALEGVRMELEDGSYPLVQELIGTDNPAVAFKDADFAVLVGGFPRKAGMLRKDLLARNAPIFKGMGSALEKYAKATAKVLVIANPANTNCLTCATHAPKIPKRNFAALTRLDLNRASAQVAKKLGVPVREVSNVIIWGNHSATQVPDVNDLKVVSGGAAALNQEWVRGEFTKTVQQRGKSIIDARGFSSAMSAANATKDCLRDWVFGTPEGKHTSMAVYSDGSYNVEKGIFYSFPVSCANGEYQIVQDIKVSDDVATLMKATEKELLDEKTDAGLV